MATKKAPASKKAAAPAKAGATRPKFTIDPAQNQKLTDRKTLFFKFPVGNTTLRVLPRFDGASTIFAKSVLHYTVKTKDLQRNIAPACLEEHGKGDCYICKFTEWMKAQEDAVLQEIGDGLYPNNGLSVQAFVLDATKAWAGPYLVGIGAKLATEMSNLLVMANDNDIPYFCDPEMGEAVVVSRTGTGKFDTKYQLMQTGKRASLDTIIPDWEKRIFKDLWKKLDVKVLTAVEQKEALMRTFPDLPWKEITKAIG